MTQKKPKEMGSEHTKQALHMLCALQRAIESLEHMSDKEVHDRRIAEKERMRAITALRTAKQQLSEPSKNRHDLNAGVLLIHLDGGSRLRVAQVLRDNTLLKLSHFGNRSWGRIQAAFNVAIVPIPLAFTSFHAAYQEELQASRSASQGTRVAPPPCSTSAADMV